MDNFIYKPIDQASNNCSPTASNCVIWQGPDIPFLGLCKGDSITKVTYELAYKVWTLYQQLEPTKFDYTCLKLEGCAPKTFHDLFQAVITKICEISSTTPADNCCDLIPKKVLYSTNRLGTQASGVIPSTSYTVPTGEAGKYEVHFVADAVVLTGNELEVSVCKNGTSIDPNVKKKVVVPTVTTESELRFTTNIVVFASEIVLVVGDTLDLRLTTSDATDAYLNFGTYKLTKIE